MRRGFPWWRLGLGLASGLSAATSETTSARIGWVTLGCGLVSWGVWDLVAGRSESTVRLTPVIGRQRVGLALSGGL